MSVLFNREDWKLFRTIDTLCQKAGVSRELLPRLVVKELVDNALDICEWAEVGFVDDSENSIYIQDNGNGIDPLILPQLFCINRGMISSKLLRLPTRGALGNGLRVVMGAVVAGGGWIRIGTRGTMYDVVSNDLDGSSEIRKLGSYGEKGTRIEFSLGSIPLRNSPLYWGQEAISMARGTKYKGKTSAWWYTSEAFFEMLNASDANVGGILNYLDVPVNLAKQIINMPKFTNHLPTKELTFDDSEELMTLLRKGTKNTSPKQIGEVGDVFKMGYGVKTGVFSLKGARGKHWAEIPVTTELWCRERTDGSDALMVYVNKTPIVSTMWVDVSSSKVIIRGSGVSLQSGKTKAKNVDLFINIVTPYMPITSDGKAPNFIPLKEMLQEALKKAVAQDAKSVRARALQEATEKVASETSSPVHLIRNEKDVLFAYMEQAVSEVSENGKYMFSLRQLYYALRPRVIDILRKEPDYNYFGRCITEWESTRGDLESKGLYRDPRGTLYTPHSKAEIPVGTLSVKQYKRPDWTFNRILYSEKEGLFPALKQVDFPERFDCALLSSKGFASRAVRDLLDMLGDGDEEIEFFCIHDGDNAGTLIYETLQEETKARAGRRVKIINLGLEPWEGMEMGLQVENFANNEKRRRPSAAYVKDYYDRNDSTNWDEWLQSHRIELNAMPPAQFIQWLERKFQQYDSGKLVPPESVLRDKLEKDARTRVENIIRDRILTEAKFLEQVEDAFVGVKERLDKEIDLEKEVTTDLLDNRIRQWTAPVSDIAERIVLEEIK